MACVVVFEGEYDLACKDRLRAELTELSQEPSVVLDLARVTFCDSTCLSELIWLARDRSQRGLTPATVVARQDGPVQRLFDLTSVGQLFNVAPSLETAMGNGEMPVFRQSFAGAA